MTDRDGSHWFRLTIFREGAPVVVEDFPTYEEAGSYYAEYSEPDDTNAIIRHHDNH